MGLFFPTKRPATPSVPTNKPSLPANDHSVSSDGASSDRLRGGQVTRKEFVRDVMGDLRREGVSKHDREIIETAASGHLDHNGFQSTGMSYRETQDFTKELDRNRINLGLDKKDVDKLGTAINNALKES